MLGGGRALLMQLAHPLVAAGVAQHSDFRERPIGRLLRTLQLTLAIVFGTYDQAVAAARQINLAHQPVRGVLTDGSGGIPAGTPYRAQDPELLLWVHATLVDSAVVTYETFVAPLGAEEKETYLSESRRFGQLLGIPPDAFWPGWAAFQDYLQGMYRGPVRVSGEALELAQGVLDPRLPWVPAFCYAPVNVITSGLLPAPLREGYRLAWRGREQATFSGAVRLARLSLKAAPASLRLMAAFRRAKRAGLERASPGAG